MPPKNAGKGGQAASKKAENKKKEKVIEDKTFGLKNKKGGKQQKFIQQVQKQVHTGGNKSVKQLEKEKEQAKLDKEEKKKELNEINQLFKPVQIINKGVDPKSVLCAFFKQGQCSKGAKCKFSHDLTVERKSEKRNAFVDIRRENQTNEDWDEETLKEVIEKKHNKNMPTSDIICKYFLDAVENNKYGWFWECPNGVEKCIYRHALPPGFVLKKDKKRLDKKDEISLEELIEKERAALGHNTTRVTLESFLIWKKQKLKEKEEKDQTETAKKKSDYKSGKEGGISGREIFTFDPSLINKLQDMDEDDAEFDLKNIENEDENEERIQFKEIDVNSFMAEYESEMNNCPNSKNIAANKKEEINGEGAVAIDEDLFEEDDEDLQELDEQLNEMNLS